MMSTLKLILLCFILHSSVLVANTIYEMDQHRSGSISFIGPCSETPILTHQFDYSDNLTVGDLTIHTLDEFDIPYKGTRQGISAISNSPTGLDAMEVISDNEMMAYGWCYSINGVTPDNYADTVFVKESDTITWWYGYAHYLDGEWVSSCNPSYLRKSSQFCQ